jgi:hypothetical protein
MPEEKTQTKKPVASTEKSSTKKIGNNELVEKHNQMIQFIKNTLS